MTIAQRQTVIAGSDSSLSRRSCAFRITEALIAQGSKGAPPLARKNSRQLQQSAWCEAAEPWPNITTERDFSITRETCAASHDARLPLDYVLFLRQGDSH